jgi:hypothetical protein
MSQTIVTVSGITFDVEFDYQPKEMETMYYPGCNESIDITCVKMQDVEIGEIINPYWLGRIEETLMEMH